jgi:hypothetical protein
VWYIVGAAGAVGILLLTAWGAIELGLYVGLPRVDDEPDRE